MGCGESKHAVATTESISTSKRLNSGNSKKVQNVELPNDSNVSTIEKTTNALPNGPNNPTIDKSKIETSTNTLTTLPASINQEIPKNIVKNDKDVTKTTQENAIIADVKKDLSLVVNKENDEQLNKAKVVEPSVTLKKENEGHDRELSLESHDDFLSVNDTKSEGQSPSKNVTESIIVQEDENSIDLVNTVNQSITKEAEEYENINDTEFDGQTPACENIVESGIQEDEKLIDLVNTVNESTPKEEEKDESSKIQVLSETMDEVKEASPSIEIDASNKVEKEESPLVEIETIDKEEKNDIVSNMGARSDEISED